MSLSNPLKWFTDWMRGGDEEQRTLSADACLKYAPVWYAVSRIAGHVGQLPCICYRNEELTDDEGDSIGEGSKPDKRHPGYRLIKSRPNGYQTAYHWKSHMQSHALLYGNGRSIIVRDQLSTPIELLPVDSERSFCGIVGGVKLHAVPLDEAKDAIPTTSADKYEHLPDYWVFEDQDVFHLMGLSLNGIEGLRLSEYASRSIGLGLDGEKQAAKSTKKGFSGGVVFEAPPGSLRREDEAKEFLSGLRNQFSWDKQAEVIGLLREGVKATVLSSNARDMQAIESRTFQRQDVALWFLLEAITGDPTANSYNSLAERNMAYLLNCLGKWAKAFEEQCDAKLLSEEEQRNYTHYFRFNMGALLKQDMATTATTLVNLVNGMVLNRNEARALLDYNPVEGGDEFVNPATTSTRSGQPTEDDEMEPPTQSSNGDAATRAIESRLAHMLGVECNRIRNLVKAPNFCKAIDQFYTDWEIKLADVCESLGVDRQHATRHCAESKQRLLDIAGESTVENLRANVERAVASWEARANRFSATATPSASPDKLLEMAATLITTYTKRNQHVSDSE